MSLEIKEEMTLPELVKSFSTIAAMLAESGGELTPEMEEALNSLDVKTAGKIDGYHFFMERLDAEAEFWKAEAESRAKIAKGCLAIKSRIKGGIENAMIQLGVNEINGNAKRAVLTATKGRLVIENEELIPADYKIQVTTTELDREKIRKELDDLGAVAGAKIEGGFAVRFYNAKAGKK